MNTLDEPNVETQLHGCALCQKLIHHGLLMCRAHWKLVPGPQQKTVYCTWARLRNAGCTSRSHLAQVRADYDVARHAAIESAQYLLDLRAELSPNDLINAETGATP